VEENMNFSEALDSLRNGAKMARRGWNATKMGLRTFAVLMPELNLAPFNNQDEKLRVNDRTAKFIGKDTKLNSQPYFALFTGVEGANWQPGWVPSTSDLLASDWFEVE
jgi:hypothetical protein